MPDASAADLDSNPLRDGLRRTRRGPPCSLVIFGASGDLAHRKLIPAVYALACEDLVDDRTQIVGVSRRDWSDDEFRARMRAAVAEFGRLGLDDETWERFASRIIHVQIAREDPAEYAALVARLDAFERAAGTPTDRVHYLATPPSLFAPVARRLAASGAFAGAAEGRTRLVVEKPFGHDLESARALNRDLVALIPESAIFRIDHYLGKETVQNLLVLRFANGMFEPLWNNRYVDHVQLTVAESLGVTGRGAYFEESGIVRDMVQNHMFQFLALTAMEPPSAFAADEVRDEKVKVLRALRPVDPARIGEVCARGQYTRGAPGGKEIPGYREEENVAAESRTETYVALELRIDNWRWAGVPFFLRVGKGLPKKTSEIAIHFKEAPLRLFGGAGGGSQQTRNGGTHPNRSGGFGGLGAPPDARSAGLAAPPDARSGRFGGLEAPPDAQNVLAIRIQPDEGMSLRFHTKVPGPEMLPHPVTMDFRYGTSFGAAPPEAYERLLLDALLGDGTLFTRDDEVEASWTWISALRDAWAGSAVEVPEDYEAGTWGPAGADRLIERSGRRWRRP